MWGREVVYDMIDYREEEKRFVDLLLSTSTDIQPIIDKIIEYTLCLKAIENRAVYEVSHDFDPSWDCSGHLFRTKEKLSISSTKTLEEISDMYNGNTTASYLSGCGLFHDRFIQDVEENVKSFLYDYVDYYIRECFKYKLFPNYLTKEFVFEDDDRIESNLLVDTKTELFYSVFSTEEDPTDCRIFKNLPTEIGQEKVCDVYKKHEFIFKRYEKDIDEYYIEKENNRNRFMKEAEEKLASLHIPEKFKKHISKKTDEDKKLYRELLKTFSKEELSILFGMRILTGSNSVSDEFISSFNSNLSRCPLECPDIFDEKYFVDGKPDNWIKYIDKVVQSEAKNMNIEQGIAAFS